MSNLVNPYRFGAAAASTLDPNPPAHGWSIRRLRSAYSGAVLRVRRTSDNTEQDIGFNTGGLLDTAAIESFIGSSNGLVAVWYDQGATGGWDVSQTTTNLMPRIATSGVVELANSLPTVTTAGFDRRLVKTSISGGNASSHFVAAVCALSSSAATFGRLLTMHAGGADSDSPNRWAALLRDSTTENMRTTIDNAGISQAITYDALSVVQSRVGTNLKAIRVNGASETTSTASLTPDLTYTQINMFCRLTSDHWRGKASELCFYTTDPGPTIRDFVRDNHNAYFGAY